jgi:hypothetical protein
MQRPLDLAPPEVEEAGQLREDWGAVQFLPDEEAVAESLAAMTLASGSGVIAA